MDLNIDLKKIRGTPLKIGFNHTCKPDLDHLLRELKPKVIRTYFTIEDVKRSYDIGAEPLVGVRFMPKHLSLTGSRESPPIDYRLWGEYVSDIASDILKAGMKPKYYSIWNEPERRDSPIFWEGTMEDYVSLFEYASRALKRVDKECYVGGPETTKYEPKWIRKLINSSIEKGFDLDFLSFHQFEDPPALNHSASLARQQYYQAKSRVPEIHISEWGFNVKDAFLTHQHITSAEEADIGFYCKDFFFERKWKCSVIDDGCRKKDTFYLLREYALLENLRISTHTFDKNVKVIASKKENRIVLLISRRGELTEIKSIRVKALGGDIVKITSLEEITSNGLIKLNAFYKDELELECRKVYLVNGEIDKFKS